MPVPETFCFMALNLLMMDSDVENDTEYNKQLQQRQRHLIHHCICPQR